MRPEPTATQVAGARRLKIGFIVLVGLSGGLIAIQANAPLPVIVASVLSGLAVGAALLWYLVWVTR